MTALVVAGLSPAASNISSLVFGVDVPMDRFWRVMSWFNSVVRSVLDRLSTSIFIIFAVKVLSDAFGVAAATPAQDPAWIVLVDTTFALVVLLGGLS